MAITVIDGYSDNIGTTSIPPAGDIPALAGGTAKRTIYFQITFASQASGHDVMLGFIPKGARILGGTHIANGALANSATTAIGLKGVDESGFIDAANTVSDNIAILKAAATLSTTLVPFGLTQALSFGYVAEKDLYLTLTTGAGTVAVEVVRGWCDILLPV